MNKIQRKINTKIGAIYLIVSDDYLYGIFWNDQKITEKDPSLKSQKILDKAEKQVSEYLSGKRKTFDLPLKLEGTDFQKKVWAELAKIPYGETRSYKEIAIALKNINACRAVGTANGKNPISLIIPCHRVINEGGKLGGYAGGLDIKEFLLSLEKKS